MHREENPGFKYMYWLEPRLGTRWGMCVHECGKQQYLAWMS